MRLRRLLLAGLALVALATPATAQAEACDRPLAAGDQTVSLTSGDRDRPFELYVPRAYDGHTALPLVLNLHGTSSDGAGQMDISGLRAQADADRFLVAAPTGGAVSASGATWVVPGTPPRGDAPPGGYPDDLAYLADVITRVQEVACQDRARVIATGYSGGGRMSSALACDLADRVTAIVANAGLRAGAPRTAADGTAEPDPATCAPARRLPIVAVHGTIDPVNPYDGGGQADWGYGVPAAFARWQALLGCSATFQTTSVAATVDLLEGTGCAGGSALRLFRINGGGHQWFGGDPTKNPLYLVLGLDPGQLRTSDVVADAVRSYAIRTPQAVLRLTCRPGRRLRLVASATTDSPLASLTARVGRRPRRSTARARTARTVRVRPGRRVRVTATATDRAGLTHSVAKSKRC